MDIELEFDQERTDQYGRLLSYVYPANGSIFNVDLVEEGYAQAYPYPPNTKYEDRFAATQDEARNAELGLWGLSENQQCKLADRGNGIGEGTPGCVIEAPREPDPTPFPSGGDLDCADFASQIQAQEEMIRPIQMAWTRTGTAVPARPRMAVGELAGLPPRALHRLPRRRVHPRRHLPHRAPPVVACRRSPRIIVRRVPPSKATSPSASTTCREIRITTLPTQKSVLPARRQPRLRDTGLPKCDRRLDQSKLYLRGTVGQPGAEPKQRSVLQRGSI